MPIFGRMKTHHPADASAAPPLPTGLSTAFPGEAEANGPSPSLRARDAVAITIGIVVGAGIFRAPSLIAGASGSEAAVLAAWVAGGLLSIIGALCYAELAAAYPHAGGD